MMVEIDSEVIAEVRNALQIIMGNAELIKQEDALGIAIRPDRIIEQVKRIDQLLPKVKFEE